MIADGAQRALQADGGSPGSFNRAGTRRSGPVAPPAAADEAIAPILARLDTIAHTNPVGPRLLLTNQEATDLLDLQRKTVYYLGYFRHIAVTSVGSKTLLSLEEIRRYLLEGPRTTAHARVDWRPLVEEFPGKRGRERLLAVGDLAALQV